MKVGDKVAVLDMEGYALQIATIEKETKLYWIVGGNKYRKDSLIEPGRGWYRIKLNRLPKNMWTKSSKEELLENCLQPTGQTLPLKH